MKGIKAAGIFLLLAALTLFAVFIPKFTILQAVGGVCGKEENWQYTPYRTEFTSRQLAQLCNEGKLGAVYTGENYRIYEENDSLRDMMELCFGENRQVADRVKEIIAGYGGGNMASSNVLTVVNDRPVVFNIVSVSLNRNGYQLDMMYEEKTKTIIYFFCSFGGLYDTDSLEKETSFAVEMHNLLDRYYSEHIGAEGLYYVEYQPGEAVLYPDAVYMMDRCFAVYSGIYTNYTDEFYTEEGY